MELVSDQAVDQLRKKLDSINFDQGVIAASKLLLDLAKKDGSIDVLMFAVMSSRIIDSLLKNK
jgi:hypothetical protein